MANVVVNCYDGAKLVEIVQLSRAPLCGEEILISDHEQTVARYVVLSVSHESGRRREGTYLACHCKVATLKARGAGTSEE